MVHTTSAAKKGEYNLGTGGENISESRRDEGGRDTSDTYLS